jgi:hypothetical protein
VTLVDSRTLDSSSFLSRTNAAAVVVSELATNAVLASDQPRERDGHGDQASRVALRLTY